MRLPLALILLAASSPTLAAESIVGLWRATDGICTPADGSLSVGPLTLAQDEVVCDFDAVKREGEVVTWQGRCEAAGEDPVPPTVVARHHGGILAITRNGIPDGDAYVRCDQ